MMLNQKEGVEQVASPSSSHAMPFGATLLDGGGVRFNFFAPACDQVMLRLDDQGVALPMEASQDGWHHLLSTEAAAGSRYRFELPGGLQVPDPASRFQPEDVHGPSQVIDPKAFTWTDQGWRGRPWGEAVFYELHVGTFTAEGTFQAAVTKLDHLVSLGITALQIMPVAEFAGRRGWGYDGVLLYAPDSSYGHPDDFRALVDAAHARGLMVFLDVVYNHYGPDGNYLSAYAPQFFTERHHTPWGAAINYDGQRSRVVRDFAIHNALYWAEEFHVDGLRLDAVHAIVDDSPTVLIVELAEKVRALDLGRPIRLVLENEENETYLLNRDASGSRFTAQWNDDVHHVLHTAATQESAGYYEDYCGDTDKLGRALAEGFAFQGEMMNFRGSPRGEPSRDLPPDAFVAFIQNHDQIGNRPFGDRLSASVAPDALRTIAAVQMLLPQIPMMFMGEEWGSTQPFQFFCDFQGELADLVREGRRAEFKHFPEFRDDEARTAIPDPLAEDTFQRCKLNWADLDLPSHRSILSWYREILAVRREHIVPLIRDFHRAGEYRQVGPQAVSVEWRSEGGKGLRLDANLKADPQAGFTQVAGQTMWQEGRVEPDQFGPWTVRWTLLQP